MPPCCRRTKTIKSKTVEGLIMNYWTWEIWLTRCKRRRQLLRTRFTTKFRRLIKCSSVFKTMRTIFQNISRRSNNSIDWRMSFTIWKTKTVLCRMKYTTKREIIPEWPTSSTTWKSSTICSRNSIISRGMLSPNWITSWMQSKLRISRLSLHFNRRIRLLINSIWT